MRMTNKKWELSCHLVTKQLFRHFLNSTPNQKTSFSKVLQFGMLFENSTSKVKVKLSFGHKAVISSLSKLNTKSKNFFYKSSSVWYAIWEFHIKTKVELSFSQNAVILSLSKLNTESKTSFYKSCSVCHAIRECRIKVKVKLSLGHKAVISSLS